MNKERLQFIVVCAVCAMWVLGVLVAWKDGNLIMRATTPLVTMMFGWLFAARITGSDGT